MDLVHSRTHFPVRPLAAGLVTAVVLLVVASVADAEECFDVQFQAPPVVNVDSDAGEISITWTTLFVSESPIFGESQTFINRVSLWGDDGDAGETRGDFREAELTMGAGGQVVSEFVFDGLDPGTYDLVVHLDLFDDVKECDGGSAAEQAANLFAESFEVTDE